MSSIKLKGSTSGDVTITVPAQAGTNTVTIPAVTGTLPLSNLDHVTNRPNANPIIINGDMQIAQRGTSHTSQTGVGYHLDRFETSLFNAGSGVYQVDQSTTVPSGQGFTNSVKVFCTTAETSQNANNQMYFQTQLEGTSTSFLNYYVASPDTVTIAFYVRSNRTGSYSFAVKLSDNGSSENSTDTRIYHKTYSISSADTWEKKVISITLDSSTSETKVTGTGFAVALQFWLGAGSNRRGASADNWQANGNATTASDNLDLLGSTSNNWFITGIQMEVGSFDSTTIPPFQHESYGDNLARCQRYFYRKASGNDKNVCSAAYYSNTIITSTFTFPVEMRTAPSLVQVTGTNYYIFYRTGANDQFDGFTHTFAADSSGIALDVQSGASGTMGHGGRIATLNDAAFIGFEAEL